MHKLWLSQGWVEMDANEANERAMGAVMHCCHLLTGACRDCVAAAIEKAVGQARLEEAEWWSAHTGWAYSKPYPERLAELRALAGSSGPPSRT